MPTYSVLNVAPQSTLGSPNQPRYRRKVTLDDHHQTWLVNYNEIREEVNSATADNVPDRVIYRNDQGNFAANQVVVNSMILGGGGPNANSATSPISIGSTGITLNSPATLDVGGDATFSQNVQFGPTSSVELNGTTIANGPAEFRDLVRFVKPVEFTNTSEIKSDAYSYFNADMEINANLDVTGDVEIVGDIDQTGNTVIVGNVDISESLIVRKDLKVLGDSVRFEVSDLNVEDRNITVNLNGFETKASGIWIERTGTANAGYLQVSSTSEAEFEFKPPLGNKLTLAMPVRDVRFQLDDDFYADQEVATTSDVSFHTIKVDTSFSRHGSVPSVIQQADPIAKDFGWISTPWVYTNAIESSDTVTDLETTGVFMGGSTYTRKDEISLVSKGKWRFYADDSGELHGINTSDPVETLHVSGDTPTMLVSTKNYTEKATVALADFAEDYKSSGMYLAYDTVTGYGALELTPISPTTKFTVSVGGYQKAPEVTIEQSKVSIHPDLLVEKDATIDQSLFVNDTVYALSNLVGINNAAPTEALDVSGNIRGDSDLILNGLGPFAKIGTVTTLENFGRAGVVIEEETPIVQLSTTQNAYRHGSQVYFNDAVHDRHWSIGTTSDGNTLDFGKSFGYSANTPEHGLDEYSGETLFRLNDEDRAEFILHSDASTPGMVINTRTNGVQLYLGEKPDVLTSVRSTTGYANSQFSSVVQWHGDASTVGELSYFPNGNDDGEFGSFRFSRTNGTVNTSAPSAKVGVEQLYAHDRIGIKELSPTADLHISNDTGEIFMSTEDDDTLISMTVHDGASEAKIRGEHISGSSYFQLSAQNPATLELGSGPNKLTQSADSATGIKYRIESSATQWQELKNDSTTNHYTSHFGDSEYSIDVYSTEISQKASRTNGFEHKIHVTDTLAESTTKNSIASISHKVDDDHPKIQFDGTSHRMLGGSTQIYDTTTSLWNFSIDVNFSQNVTIDGNLDVDGNTTLDTLTVDESATFNDSTSFNNDVTFNSGTVTINPGSQWEFKEEVTFTQPIVFNHNQPLMTYDGSIQNWILNNSADVTSGLYWTSSGSTNAFPPPASTTNTEDAQNQFSFVHGGVSKVALDMDHGSIFAKGDIVAENDLIGFSTSDIKYKENVEKIDHALEKIDGIRGVSFDWKQNPSGYSGHDVGVIAQEIEEILPEAVRTGGYGQKQVNYEKIIPLLIECIKELKAKIGE